MPQSRQLAAIMFTDIQGYTAIMQHDEELAIKIRDRHRQVFNSITEKFNGTILQYFGDGTLSTFKSAIDAVKCAMEMQSQFQKEPVIPVRIGIHLGDVMVRKDEIIGDGVNVASRIESLAVPGSVFISDKVYDEIKNHTSIETQSLRTFELKNVDKPIEVFAISNKGLIIPETDQIVGNTKEKKPEPVTSDTEEISFKKKNLKWVGVFIFSFLVIIAAIFVFQNFLNNASETTEIEKSIAVLPFANISDDPKQEYFSDGITEDIIAHLSKVADLRVVSRTSTTQYKNTSKTIPMIGKELGVSNILEGSVRKSGNQVRITAQLIDANTDMHIWAETYDRNIDKIFDIQTEVATEIVDVLKATLSPKEKIILGKALTSEITAYDYYLKGMEELNNSETKKDLEKAAGFFEQAISIDTGFAAAYVGLAWSLIHTSVYGSPEEIWKDSVLALNRKALLLDPELDEAHFLQSEFYNWEGEIEKALKGYEKVLQINPNHDQAMIELGAILMEQNDLDRGMNLIMDGLMLHLNRKDPEFYAILGEAYYQIGELYNSKYYYKQAIKLKPDYQRAYFWLAEIALQENNYDEVLIYVQKMVEVDKNINSLDRLAWAYLMVGNYTLAGDTWTEMGELTSGFENQYYTIAYKHRLAYVQWQLGNKEEAMLMFNDFIAENLAIIENGIETNVQGQPYDLAGVYAFLGQNDEAMKWIKIAKEKGFLPIGLLERDPLFNGIRTDEDFREFIMKQEKEEDAMKPRLQAIREKLREMEEKGVLSVE